jgi:predicted ATPase/signal transduction histidine kinase/DNA-binding NarL/FixJ family response regulator
MELTPDLLKTLPCIHRCDRTLIHLWEESEYGRPVVVKTPCRMPPSSEELQRLENEYTLTKDLVIPGVRDAIDKILVGGSPALILEYIPGDSLRDAYVTQRRPLVEILRMSLHIIPPLAAFHEHHLIHNRLNASNILLNPKGLPVIIDFAQVSRKDAAPFLPETETDEEVLFHVSPEQTGRMNRSVDQRSDYYALGVILYGMLTGEILFKATTFAELIHCHMATLPVPPATIDPSIPEQLSDIIMKLLAKNPDDRYQTAPSLKSDLEICLKQFEQTGTIESFTPAAGEVASISAPHQFHGRQEELTLLKQRMELAKTGSFEIILISGDAGMGKTALAEQAKTAVFESGGIFISGAHDEDRLNIPYHGIIQALGGLVDRLLTLGREELDDWRQALTDALGTDTRLLMELVPRLALIIGDPPAPTVSMPAAGLRFSTVLRNMILAAAQKAVPLVLFLDNLQWADDATLNLLDELATLDEKASLVLIIGFRNREIDPDHPASGRLDRLSCLGNRATGIALSPLSESDMAGLVSDVLGAPSSRIRPLSDLVHTKSGGCPPAALQFLHTLLEEKTLSYQSETRKWHWDETKILGMEISDNVASLLSVKISKLDAGTREILSTAACIGNDFDLSLLAAVSNYPLEQISRHLLMAERDGLLLPVGEDGKNELNWCSAENASACRLEFSHTLVRKAAYSSLAKKDRRRIHLAIGRELLRRLPEAALEEDIFTVAAHLNEGFQNIRSRTEKLELARINLMAGRKARRTAAFQSAIWHLSMGIGLLPPDKWETEYDLAIRLYKEAVDAEYLSGNLQRAELLAGELISRARDLPTQIGAMESKIFFFTSHSRNAEAIQTGREALARLDFTMPVEPEEIQSKRRQLEKTLLEKLPAPETFMDRPALQDDRLKAIMRILEHLILPAHLLDFDLLRIIVMEMVNITLLHGNSPQAANAFEWQAMLLCGIHEDIDTGYRLGVLSMALQDEYRAAGLRSPVGLLFHTCITHWQEPARASIPHLEEIYRTCMKTGDLASAHTAAGQSVIFLFGTGTSLGAVDERRREYAEALDRFQTETPSPHSNIWGQVVHNFMGRATDPCRLKGDLFDDSEIQDRITRKHAGVAFCALCARTILQYFFGRYADAVVSATRADSFRKESAAYFHAPQHTFYFALSLLASFPKVPPETREEYMLEVSRLKEQLYGWAGFAPDNFKHRADLVDAETARLRGDFIEAIRLYGEAASGAAAGGFIHEEALTHEREALLFLEMNRADLAGRCIEKAVDGYRFWGAVPKANALADQYAHLVSKKTAAPLDTTAVVNAAQMLAREIHLENLLHKLMQIVIENAGAEKGLFIENRNDTLLLRAKWQIGQQDVKTVEPRPIEQTGEAPLSVINYSVRTKTPVVMNDAVLDATYMDDPYISKNRVRSLLCLPLIHQGKLAGMLYLENNLASHVFTPNRIALFESISTQAAISIENARLYSHLEDTIRDLQQAEAALSDRVRYEAELSKCSQALLADLPDAISAAIGHLLEASKACRIYIFENFQDPDHGLCMRQIHEVCAPGITPQIDNAELQGLPYKNGFEHWLAVLGAGKPIMGLVKNFPSPIKDLLTDQNILSILVLPIQVEGQWYGFIGFDDTQNERIWSDEDMHLLQTAAGLFGNYIERKNSRKEIERHRDHLDELVRERTAELAAAKEAAESANRAKSAFLTHMSHELRTPLNAILGYAQILIPQENISDKQRRQLETVQGSGEHLLSLINDLLDMSKIEARKMGLAVSEFSPASLLHQVFHISKVKADEKNLRMIYDEEAQLPESIRGDAGKLKQILLNLASNAIRNTSRGDITLRARQDGADPKVFYFEVSDTGAGIPEDKLKTIFEPFRQLDIPDRPREGTGLGLSITSGLLTLMKGRMEVESRLGRGSTFRVILPFEVTNPSAPKTRSVPSRIVGYHGRRRSLFIIDDDITSIDMLMSALKPLGFDVQGDVNPTEGLRRIIDSRPDLVLLDMVMPQMNGIEAGNALRTAVGPSLKIIGISASLAESELRMSFVAACDDFLSKPVEMERLIEKIGTHLEIDWQTAAPGNEQPSPGTEEKIHIPPGDRLEELHELARRGDMLKIREWIDGMEKTDSRNIPLCRHLHNLANDFKVKAILDLASGLIKTSVSEILPPETDGPESYPEKQT